MLDLIPCWCNKQPFVAMTALKVQNYYLITTVTWTSHRTAKTENWNDICVPPRSHEGHEAKKMSAWPECICEIEICLFESVLPLYLWDKSLSLNYHRSDECFEFLRLWTFFGLQ